MTMIVGFTWGGRVTGGTARAMAVTMGEEAVVKRLAPICVVQFNEEPEQDRRPSGSEAMMSKATAGRRCPAKRKPIARSPGCAPD
jgi:hypothetical protein